MDNVLATIPHAIPDYSSNNGVIADKIIRLNVFLCAHGFNCAINLTIL